MTAPCQYCHALQFPGECLNCCNNGKFPLPRLSQYPPNLQALFMDTTQAKNFRLNIHNYDSAFSFASFRA